MHGMKDVTGKMLIGGKLVDSLDGGWLESINPADETQLGRVPMGSKRDMDAAVDAAAEAFPAWAALSMEQRAGYVHKLADAILAKAEDFARIESLDTGNTLPPMRHDVINAVERMRFAAGLAYEIKGETIPSSAGNIHLTLRVPYGVVGRIIPFNHPIGFAASRIAPAIVTGNTMVIKPSEQSPLSAAILAELCAAILPPGVVNIVTGGRETGEALVRNPKVKRIAFIGSAASGMAIQKAAAETAVKHVTLELGGKNPLVAFPDADLDRVAAAAVGGMNFGWQGQSCGSMSRILLHEDIYDAVLEKILERVKTIKVGHPLDDDTNMGPINNQGQYKKVLSYIEIGRSEGAKLLLGGGRPKGEQFKRGYWVEPTVFGDVNMSMRIAKEEIFGPVMSILKFKTEAEAIAMANAVDLGLTGAVWTQDISRALRVAQAIEAGYIWVNGVGTHYRGVPYGGFKNSGVGREEGLSEILSYTEEKVINLCNGDIRKK
ncbi:MULTISPECIES: aldehyde dehydrogenase family protein [unclassified Beijerinckia]|uniref:aldehyde dehydrogenase family protein n=1 Tax=unclassified Beijerinckia TaxID=2638183 RepID=UPI0008951676|nr:MULTISPECIES: aldehyde dehydrogenase family protein [unclassified Beijerinckia]MDH7795059.1 betaine-aldehyde dehydrogenase [Beijerinckia sp. GAS462]SEB85908.1 Acyl-CoA reductase [Beijerinckia sp. 28-YEA-48]